MPVLVDSNVLPDVATEDPTWGEWSAQALARAADEAVLGINPIVFAEVSVGFGSGGSSATRALLARPSPTRRRSWRGSASSRTGGGEGPGGTAPRLLRRRSRIRRRPSAPDPGRCAVPDLLPAAHPHRALRGPDQLLVCSARSLLSEPYALRRGPEPGHIYFHGTRSQEDHHRARAGHGRSPRSSGRGAGGVAVRVHPATTGAGPGAVP